MLKISAKLYKYLSNADKVIQDLFTVLPLSQAENLTLHILQQFPDKPFSSANPAFPLLINTPNIWNEEISKAVISSIKISIKHKNQVNNWQFGSALEKFSLKIAPSTYTEAVDSLTFESTENIHKLVIDAINKFLTKLQFRYEMRKSIEI